MKRLFSFISFWSAVILCASAVFAGDLGTYLPGPEEAAPWKQDVAPEQVEGEDLYQLIDGAADLYLKHGFKRAISASFMDEDQRTIAVQIFEMESVEGARTLQKEKIGEAGEKLDVGDTALLEDYFLNFQKGRFQVTLTGYEAVPETVEGLKVLARLIAEKLPETE